MIGPCWRCDGTGQRASHETFGAYSECPACHASKTCNIASDEAVTWLIGRVLTAEARAVKWVPVSEELPEPGLIVLAIFKRESHTSKHFTAYRTAPLDEGGFWSWRDSHTGSQLNWFTHWQRMTQPDNAICEHGIQESK